MRLWNPQSIDEPSQTGKALFSARYPESRTGVEESLVQRIGDVFCNAHSLDESFFKLSRRPILAFRNVNKSMTYFGNLIGEHEMQSEQAPAFDYGDLFL